LNGEIVAEPVYLIDIMATCVEITGGDVSYSLQDSWFGRRVNIFNEKDNHR